MTPAVQSHRNSGGEDTIAALATPPGVSGIAVIRVSGTEAIGKTADIFRGARDLRDAPSHTAHYGTIRDAGGGTIDEVLATVFRSPHSYTGEDAVEVSCHGGGIVTREVLDRILSTGVRSAEPGEFTRRAFLNGRIDLAQAESIADLIHAQSREAHQASIQQLQGALSRHVEGVREQLLQCASMLELTLDFAEEDIPLLPAERVRLELERARTRLAETLDSYRTGRVVRDGLTVVLAGRPNAGKSSLLNRVLGMERAIVTEIAGTTRDYIEERVSLRGRAFRFVDTAGLRSGGDRIETEGMRRTGEHLRTADIVCCVLDASADDARLERMAEARAQARALCPPDAAVLLLLNKTDLAPEYGDAAAEDVFPLSALTGIGVDAWTDALARRADAIARVPEAGRILVTNARHADCLRRAVDGLDRALGALATGLTEEFIAFEVRGAIDAVGEIIGAVTTDDILHSIFSRFCIGK